MPVVTTVTAFV